MLLVPRTEGNYLKHLYYDTSRPKFRKIKNLSLQSKFISSVSWSNKCTWLNERSWYYRMCSVASVLFDSAMLWTLACHAPLSMEFSKQENYSGLPCPPPGDLPDSGIEPASLMSPALAGRFFTTSTTWEARDDAGSLQNGELGNGWSSTRKHYGTESGNLH